MAFEPNKIKKPHVIAAANRIEKESIALRPSTGYDVVIKKKRYPPKEIVQFSYQIATKKDPGKIYGGEQTNSILRKLGFEVEKKINVWKLGCNWGKGAPSFYEFIKTEGIVISTTEYVYRPNDLVLITEGFTVYAIAQVKQLPTSVTDREDLEKPFDELDIEYQDSVTFAAAEWFELPETQIFTYDLRQGIRKVQSREVRDKAIDIWESKEDTIENLSFHCQTTEYFPDDNWLYPALVFVPNNWDDYGWSTSYDLYLYRSKKQKTTIGPIRILDETTKTTKLKKKFTELGDHYCSLGQTIEFYKRLRTELPLAYLNVLSRLKDCAYDEDIRNRFENLSGFQSSLLRSTEAELVLNEAKALIEEEAIMDQFKFEFSTTIGKAVEEHKVDFEFNQQDELPNRFFCLIGKNGTGKTQYISALANKLTDGKSAGRFNGERPAFSTVIAASFSYFDKFKFPEVKDISYHFIGVKNHKGLYPEDTMRNLVWEAFSKIADDKVKKALWLESIQKALETEYLDFELATLMAIEEKDEFLARTVDIFSSGQKIIFQFLTRYLSVIDKKSLLIFDEPETHLHPNITGRLLRAIHGVLVSWRSFCILSTHSPVIVQEIPSRYIRIFDRHQFTPSVRQPLIECFGENLSNISNSIFEADQEKEIYKAELERLAGIYSLEEIEALFGGRLSLNAQLFLQTLNLRTEDAEL